MGQEKSFETLCVHGSTYFEERTGAVSFPIYQCATFRHPSLGETTGYDYSRQQNPTKEELEKTIALLEKGNHGFAFATGMAAITAVFSIFENDSHIIATDDIYGGTYRFFKNILTKQGMAVSYADTGNIEEVRGLITDKTKAVFVETPSNPMMKIADLKNIIEICKKRDILVIVDNTFLSPYFMNPLELGADIVIHSGTKYLGGHNDTLAGFAILRDEVIAEKIRLYQKSTGAVIGPFDSWLLLRGIKTLALRMEKHQENALKVAAFLKKHPNVKKVFYVGLPDHKGRELLLGQARGFGGMISFEVDTHERLKNVLKKVKTILFAESLGGVETLITFPFVQTHGDIPEERRNELGVNDRLLRLSVGIESAQDIIDDLNQALGG